MEQLTAFYEGVKAFALSAPVKALALFGAGVIVGGIFL